ncbi:ATP-binding protein [Maridesulfovibrio hydrothermalis]|uniref:histidine kinase n=1 Tax=Maridesulfovibrio hydrothermalis AM13 = DSM 14728 TaxID=1121451 RepID=L0R868_9BACT|nr:ATP-binding protein [Maridesulfovibrio hydrothermalis]CCO22934.1 putative Histidine kinase [Maridesulfovibrio hydrothermalis AM13 = DSM 14728]
MKKKGSLHKRVVAGLVLLSIFTATLIFVGNAHLSKKVMNDISRRNLGLAHSIGMQAGYILRQPAESLKELSTYIATEPDAQKSRNRISALLSFSKLLEMIQVMDSSGRVTEVFPANKEQVGMDLSNQPFFIKAKSEKGLHWTDAFHSGRAESPLVTLSTAYPGGVLAGHLNLRIVSEITRVSFPDSKQFVCIVDRCGTVIAHSGSQETGTGANLLDMKSVKKGLSGETGTFSDSYKSIKGLASVAPVPGTGWTAMVFQPESEALASIHTLRAYGLISVMMVTLAGIAAIAFFRDILFRPIETLTERTEAVSLGEYDVRLVPEYKEFEALAASFNNMAETIGEREQEIFYEAQVNKAQAEIVRTITETNSIETLSRVVHEWAVNLTISSHGIVKILNLGQTENSTGAEGAANCGSGYTCYFHDDKSFDFPDSSINHGKLWESVFKSSKSFLSNDIGKLSKKNNLPENHFSLRRVMSAPAIYHGEQVGQIVVVNSELDYTDKDLKTLQVLADLLAVAVNRIRADQALINNESNMRKLRNYLSNIINSMPSMLIGVDIKGNITQWNKKAEQVAGLTHDEALGRPLRKVVPHLADEMKRVQLAIKTKQEQVDPKRSRYENGRTKYEDLTIYPLISNKVEGAVIRIDDVTDRVSLEQMMVQSEKMMSVGGLAAGMAHEINNPLAAILGQNRNLQRRLLEKLPKNISAAKECGIDLDALYGYLGKRDIPRMLESIDESGNRAATIVSNMLSFSRKSEKRLGYHDISKLMDKTLELASNDYDLKKEYDFRKIEIIRKYDPDLPEVLCEGNEVQQVFLNLLKNGAEAMTEKNYDSGHPCFTVSTYTQKGYAVVEIEDNGPGVDEASRIRIFEPFFTTKEVGKGTGLGLSVSYFIITDQHSGSMKVESAPGEWTRFIIKLPANGLK